MCTQTDTHAYTNTYARKHKGAYIHTPTYKHGDACIYILTQTHIRTHIYAHIHTHANRHELTHTYTHANTYTHIHIHTRKYIHTPTYTHAYIHIRTSALANIQTVGYTVMNEYYNVRLFLCKLNTNQFVHVFEIITYVLVSWMNESPVTLYVKLWQSNWMIKFKKKILLRDAFQYFEGLLQISRFIDGVLQLRLSKKCNKIRLEF